MALKRPDQFWRRGRRLPGQSSAEELGLERELTIKVYGQAAVIDWSLVQIGDVSKGDYVEIGPNGIRMLIGNTAVQVQAGDTITIGDTSTGNYIVMDPDGIYIYNNGTLTHTYDDTTAVINQDTVQVGDVSAGNYVELSSTGIDIYRDNVPVEIFAQVDADLVQGEFRVRGADATDPDGYIGMFAYNYNTTVTNSFTLNTKFDRATIDAETLLIGQVLRLSWMTTTERDALTAVNGMLIYNSTTNKFQGYAGGSWVDLH